MFGEYFISCRYSYSLRVFGTDCNFNNFVPFSVTDPLAGRITAVICVICATFSAIGGLRAIVAIGIGTMFVATAGTALPSGLALLPMGFRRMWEIASDGGRLVLYE